MSTWDTLGPKPASPAQVIFAEKIAQEKGVVIPDEAKVSSAAMSSWIEAHQNAKPSKGRPKSGAKLSGRSSRENDNGRKAIPQTQIGPRG